MFEAIYLAVITLLDLALVPVVTTPPPAVPSSYEASFAYNPHDDTLRNASAH